MARLLSEPGLMITTAVATDLVRTLREQGFAHVAEKSDLAGYYRLAQSIGVSIAEERVALREGAHAYLAKPGPVPLHTDHPQVDVIGWYCAEQDEVDGASLLLDAAPLIQALPEDRRRVLASIELRCPPVAGGPPTEQWPVLKSTSRGIALFCSPWLKSVRPEDQDILDEFRRALSHEAKRSIISIRLAPGESLLIDNQRLLHGRAALQLNSRRQLIRLWLRGVWL